MKPIIPPMTPANHFLFIFIRLLFIINNIACFTALKQAVAFKIRSKSNATATTHVVLIFRVVIFCKTVAHGENFYDTIVIFVSLCYTGFESDRVVILLGGVIMPTDTFFRLPEEKRRRIFDAAVEEFSQKSFSSASINRIVQAAGIPRGSFYQYFAGKEDIYLYVAKIIGEEKLEIFRRFAAPVTSLGFFEAVKSSLPAIFEWLDLHPDYNRIGFFMATDANPFIRNIREKSNIIAESVLAMLKSDQEAGRIRKDVDPDFLLQVYTDASFALLKGYYAPNGRAKITQQISDLVDLLQLGATPREVSK
jgi:AcrR family transcriptional regulator